MKTDKQISLDCTRLYGFKITTQVLKTGQQRSVLGAKIGSIKKTDPRIGSKIGITKKY